MARRQHEREYIWWNNERVDVTVNDQDAWQPPPEDSLVLANYACISNRPWYYFEFIVLPNQYHTLPLGGSSQVNIARGAVWWLWVDINCDDQNE